MKTDQTFHGAKLVHQVHPVPGRDASPCVTTGQGLWSNKIYHFRPDAPPSSDGDELQTEYFVKYADLPEVLRKLYQIAPKFRHLVQITEVRAVKADNLPLSAARNQDVVGIHMTWFRDLEGVWNVLPLIEEVYAQFEAQPHFGKLFRSTPERIQRLLGENLYNFKRIAASVDPEEKFKNNFVRRYLYGSEDEKFATNWKMPLREQRAKL